MAIAHLANGVNTATTGTTLTLTSPTTAVGDFFLLACVIYKGLGAELTGPDGTWTRLILGSVNGSGTAGDFSYAVFYKQVTSDDGGDNYDFFTDLGGVAFAGIMSTWTGVKKSGSPIDATGVGNTDTTSNTDDVSFPAYDPAATDVHAVFVAFYGNDLTTFDAAMSSDSNPDCTTRFDVEGATGTDYSIALTSGDNDGSNIAARTWASNSSADACNAGVVFALLPEPSVEGAPFPYIGGGYFPVEG